ncbi:unnamed protein product [Chrysodeixis includens]|uniref:Adenylate kinase n=1 Tax=Chrysodeixis includens TaxID=689277 RepID=A0A9N8KT42_CHRIL|nr:unnamed protein product [Chrysodeixis includens]
MVLKIILHVNGERNPDEVYKDFRAAVLQILGSTEDHSTMNGVSGVGVGAGGIPGEIVGVEPAPAQDRDREDRREENGMPAVPTVMTVPMSLPIALPQTQHVHETGMDRVVTPKGYAEIKCRITSDSPQLRTGGILMYYTLEEGLCLALAEVIRVRGETTTPALLWVVGGPGSNKATLCQRAIVQRPGWTHYSLGQRLRSLADAGGRPASDGALARTAVSGGELAPKELVSKLVRTAVADASRTGQGLVLDGYPRDLDQMEQFQSEFRISPRMVLLDCSKLQLGRGRRDDSVAAFRRRLEVFRELSLPMLKTMDQDHRLVIVDGDTDSPDVQAEFTRVLLEEMEKAEALAAIPQHQEHPPARTEVSSMQNQLATAVTRMGGGLANGHANGSVPNGNANHNGGIGNGFIGMAGNKVKPVLNNVSKIPTVSQLTHDDVRALYEHGSGEITMNTHI